MEFVCLFKDIVTRIQIVHTIIVILRNRYILTIVEIQSQIHASPKVVFFIMFIKKKNVQWTHFDEISGFSLMRKVVYLSDSSLEQT